MRCPFCGDADTQVKDSRPTEDGSAIRRRRFCGACSQRFTTIERVQLRELVVLKADQRRVAFDRDKLARSVRIALRKRPVEDERIERIVNSIVRKLEASGETDVKSSDIGELVMETLKEVDAVAYVRFASVYRSFQDIEAFRTELDLLRRTRRQKGELSAMDLENIETRASSAYRELQEAWHFQYVIPNHDGEDSDNWDAFYYLIGDARKTLEAFVALLQGSVPPSAEHWDQDLLPAASTAP